MKKKLTSILLMGVFSVGAIAGENIVKETTKYQDGSVMVDAGAYGLLQNVVGIKQERKVTNRMMAVRDEALRFGVQYGFAAELERLEKIIKSRSSELDKIYNFRAIMQYANPQSGIVNLLPPVIEKANNFVSTSKNRITISSQYYNLYKPARLVSIPPTWRDYLLKPISPPEQPNYKLFPTDESERMAWQQGIESGWLLGVEQADAEMSYRVNTLGRDFNGMLTYLILYKENKVSSPYVAYQNNPVQGNKNSMSVNNSVYQITAPAALNTDINAWKMKPQKAF